MQAFYFFPDRLIRALIHLPDSWRDSRNSSSVIFSHFFAKPSLILWRFLIKRGSFVFFTLHLLRRADIYLKKAGFLVNSVDFNPCFMFYNMLKVPADQNWDTVNTGYGNVHGIGNIFSRDHLFFDVALSQRPCLFRNRKDLDSIFFQRFNEQPAQFNIGGSPDFVGSDFRTIEGEMAEFCCAEKFFSDSLDVRVLRIKAVDDRCIKIKSHVVNLPQRWQNVN